MNITEIQSLATAFTKDRTFGYIQAADAAHPDIAGLKLFDAPLIGCAAAENEYYRQLVDNDEANIDLTMPISWLASAKSVLSFFFPFSERLRTSNRIGGFPSNEWLHGRVQGQEFMAEFGRRIRDALTEGGYGAVVPQQDMRFWANVDPPRHDANGRIRRQFSSNWSERHIAFGAGLGTFSLSGNIITEKGTAGRLIGVVTSAEVSGIQEIRSLTDLAGLNANCTMCGICVRRCPVGAINAAGRKDVKKCKDYLHSVREKRSPLFGCGICQTAVPCEYKNPARTQ